MSIFNLPRRIKKPQLDHASALGFGGGGGGGVDVNISKIMKSNKSKY